MLFKSARTVSREFYVAKRVYIGLTSYGLLRALRQYFAVQNLSSCCLPSPISYRNKTLYFLMLGKWQLEKGINKPRVHWMKCSCLVHKIYGYYNKDVYVQLVRSTTKQYFRERQHGPAWKCIYPKNDPSKNARNHGNLTKRTSESELHERDINFQEKIALPFVVEKNVGLSLISVEDLRQSQHHRRHHKKERFLRQHHKSRRHGRFWVG